MTRAPGSENSDGESPTEPVAAEAGARSAVPLATGRAPRATAAGPARTATELVEQLASTFAEQVGRALGVHLDESETSLAFVDHYLSLARSEDRAPILGLLAAGAGAYFGQVVAKNVGATWIGDGKDPRKLRLLMTHQFIHLCPVDQALEAIVGESLALDDRRVPPDDPAFDAGFRLTPNTETTGDELEEDSPNRQLYEDAAWITERLGELSAVPEDQYVSLTCRIETLRLMLEMLAAKHASEGRSPAELGVNAYLAAFAH